MSSHEPRAALTSCAWIPADDCHESALAGRLTARGPEPTTCRTPPLGVAFDEAEHAAWLQLDAARVGGVRPVDAAEARRVHDPLRTDHILALTFAAWARKAARRRGRAA